MIDGDKIIHVCYINNARDTIKVLIERDGKNVEEFTSKWIANELKNPDFEKIISIYGHDNVVKETEKEISKQNKKYKHDKENHLKHQKRIDEQILFEAKENVYAMEDFAKVNDKKLRRKIRKAKNTTEVTIYAAAILSKQFDEE